MVFTLWQRCRWRELPAAIFIHNGRTNQFAVVINIDTAARLSGTVEGRVRIIGGAAAAQIATAGTDIIRRNTHHRFFRCHGINRDIKGRRRDVVTRRIG